MIISIASGKGGTGKTTVATNLAVSLGKGVQLLDCDVEEPNAHLFLSPVFENTEVVHAAVPEVDEEKCNLCGKCGEICQFKAIVVIGNTVLPFAELCHSCGGCMAVCPEKAIREGPWNHRSRPQRRSGIRPWQAANRRSHVPSPHQEGPVFHEAGRHHHHRRAARHILPGHCVH
jgi:ferredoxin